MNTQRDDVKSREALATERDEATRRYKEHLGAGLGLGLVSLGAAAVGAVCPLCVVAVPAMVGSGLYQRYRKRWCERELAALTGGDVSAPHVTLDPEPHL